MTREEQSNTNSNAKLRIERVFEPNEKDKDFKKYYSDRVIDNPHNFSAINTRPSFVYSK